MGFDVERFLGIVNEGLLCCICRDVLEVPVQAPCEHAYCRQCIEGWLVHENRCPEDRKQLSQSNLKPLFRYMKNDLDKLQLRCINANLGCNHISSLEFIEGHESECPLSSVPCSNDNCNAIVLRKDLANHMASCEFRARECPNGCGLLMVLRQDKEHNCIHELKTAMDVLRSEMSCKIDEQKREMELRLNTQRCHMVQKESSMQTQMDELKSEVSRLSQKIKLLMELEVKRRQDTERLELEKRELMELLRRNRNETDRSPGQKVNKRPFTGRVTAI
ncbi:RING finger protein 151-like [Saccostrea echinata]|uniref:RING finger protein 151-like n=1 Tax=Saccostrea echinata TaxID=191078 RepID=UPI002A80A569|nr:RING finger protein 151-like [Saccostrea echinata]